MKRCVITGGGSKFGQHLTESLIQAGYFVDLITSNGNAWIGNSSVNVIPVDWKTVNLQDLGKLISKHPIDLMFFNHNSSALSGAKFQRRTVQNVKDWQQSYFVSCQLPFYMIHSSANKISANTKIAWMLSESIKDLPDSEIGTADYIGNKFTNACIMRSFSLNFPACFFGINPGPIAQNLNLAQDLVHLIEHTDIKTLNGNIFNSDGTVFNLNK
jgi:NAD(P)-dependent dehydrogenase (short-subunit alcohol dehydrogenase family)